jgi:hypothetical protein
VDDIKCKKVKLALCLTVEHYTMKTYGGVNVYTHVFFTSALVGGEWSTTRLGRLDRRLDGHQSRSGQHGEVKILAPTGT